MRLVNVIAEGGQLEIADFAQQLDETISALGSAPVVLAREGQAAAVLLSIGAYEELEELLRLYQGVNQGLADFADGKFIENERIEEWLKSWGTENELPRPEIE